MRVLRAIGPDAAFCYNPKMMAYGPPAARAAGVPRVAAMVTGLGYAFTAGGLRRTLVRAIMRRLYRRCDALVAPSESMAQVLREQRMNYDISIWSRGVDREIFHPGRRNLEWRRSLGMPTTKW